MITPGPVLPRPPLNLALVLLAAVLAACTVAVVVLLRADLHTALPVICALPAIAVLFAGTGLLAWWRRPANHIGALLTWCGATWLVASLSNIGLPLLIAAGTLTAVLPAAIVLHVLVAPTGRATDRVLREDDRERRRVLAPLILHGIVAVVTIPLVANVLRPLSGLHPQQTLALQLVAVATVSLASLAVVLRGGFAGTGELSALVTSLTTSAGSRQEMQRAVATTLGDPSATVLRWSGADGTYRDAAGAVAALPPDDERRASVPVDVGDRHVGIITYDRRLNTDPPTVTAVARVAAIALDRQQLLEDASVSRQALRDASVRLLEDGDRERRRIARDLHDGLQVSLVRLSMQAHSLAQDPSEHGGAVRAGRLVAEVDEAAAALRSLVKGVMPPPLVERGLAAAVRELAHDLPIRIRVDVESVPEQLPPPVETTAYFVVAEALTNVLKHAGASAVELSLRGDGRVLSIDVTDDGRGGVPADTSGTGLAGLRDRIDVLGGSLTVESSETGTRVRADLPCS